MKTKQSDGKFEEKERLNVAFLFVTTKVLVATKRLFVVTKVKMEKMHGLGYVVTKRRNLNK